jgi:hypothetical protein
VVLVRVAHEAVVGDERHQDVGLCSVAQAREDRTEPRGGLGEAQDRMELTVEAIAPW